MNTHWITGAMSTLESSEETTTSSASMLVMSLLYKGNKQLLKGIYTSEEISFSLFLGRGLVEGGSFCKNVDESYNYTLK